MTRRSLSICVATLLILGVAGTGLGTAAQNPPQPGNQIQQAADSPAEQEAQPGSPQGWRGWLDKLRFNPRSRTEEGIDQLDQGDAQSAATHLETAGHLVPEDPLVRYNAGTGHLLAETDQAIPHLEAATQNPPLDLAPLAHFNLGNARLAGEDAAGAIDAYKDALRASPGLQDAKHNLEVAQKLLEQQKQEKEQEQDQQEKNEDQQQDQQEKEQDDQGDDQEQQPEEGDQPQDQPQGEEPKQEPPEFAEQPDMTAEQAAAILEAVENLEREQRRLQAAEQARKQTKKGKDW